MVFWTPSRSQVHGHTAFGFDSASGARTPAEREVVDFQEGELQVSLEAIRIHQPTSSPRFPVSWEKKSTGIPVYDRGLWQNVGEVLAPRSLRRSTSRLQHQNDQRQEGQGGWQACVEQSALDEAYRTL